MNDATFRDHIAKLKDASNGRDIAADLGLRGRGKRFFCPACQDDGASHRTPDLDVSDQRFRCYRCGISGDVIDLTVIAGGMSKADAIRFLEARSGLTRGPSRGRAVKGPQKRNMKAVRTRPERADIAAVSGLYAAFLDEVCHSVTGTPGAAYLESRGIAADVADRFGVRFCPDLAGLWKLADRKSIKAAGLSALYLFQKAGLPFLVFPYTCQGKAVFIKSRCLLSKEDADRREITRFLNTGGQVPCLWNHDAIAGADQVIIAEGEMDALSAIIAGYVGVGLPGWSHWKDAWTPDFAGKDVFLVLDADDAGDKGTADIAKRFMKTGLPCPRQLVLAAGKDLNDILQAVMKDGNAEGRKS